MGPKTTFFTRKRRLTDGSEVCDVLVSAGNAEEAVLVHDAISEEEADDYCFYMNNANHVWCDNNNYCPRPACQDRINSLAAVASMCSFWERQLFRDADDHGFGASPLSGMSDSDVSDFYEEREREDEKDQPCGTCEACTSSIAARAELAIMEHLDFNSDRGEIFQLVRQLDFVPRQLEDNIAGMVADNLGRPERS
jgi:hypothetical protein